MVVSLYRYPYNMHFGIGIGTGLWFEAKDVMLRLMEVESNHCSVLGKSYDEADSMGTVKSTELFCLRRVSNESIKNIVIWCRV